MFVKKTSPNKYGDYFLAFEADGDDEPQTQEVRNNMKQINLRPNNRARIDFRDGADDPPPEETQAEPENVEDTPTGEEPVDTTGNEDFTQDQPENDAPQDTEQPAENNEENQEETQGDQEEQTAPEVTDAENPDGAPPEDQPDTTGGDENFSDGTDEQQSAEGENQEAQNAEKSGPGLEYDSTRKYKLFLDFKELYSSVENYISNLEMEIRDDNNIMATIRKSIDRLKKTRDLLFDYMTLKFTSSTYIQNLLFYQKMYAVVVMIVDVLSNTLETNKNNN